MKIFDQIETLITNLISKLIQTAAKIIQKINLPKLIQQLWIHKKRVAVVALVIYGAYYGYNFFFPKSQNQMPPTLVTTTQVEKKEIALILEATGNTVATNIVDIRPQITNVVAKIHVKDGQEVKAGDLLFTLDDRADKANVEKAKALADDGIKVNVTLCFSASQALIAAKVGAAYISPFVGRLDDISTDGMGLIQQIVDIYNNYDFATEVLVASVRGPMHIVEAARMGADVVTVPPAVIEQCFKHPLTDIGLERFLKDWEKAQAARADSGRA